MRALSAVLVVLLTASPALAQTSTVTGSVRDEAGGALSDATVELRAAGSAPQLAVTDGRGTYEFDGVAPGHYQMTFTLINFASLRRDIDVSASGSAAIDVILHFALNADVTVTGKRTFANLADVENPAENLVGIAQSASQGAITAEQLDRRPLMRTGEVLETVPGVIVTQHSGEGKANQYFLRGFNLDHGTDFASDGRRDAGEHADARARPGLLGSQLHDSGARHRRAVLEGTVLRGPGRFRDRGFVEHQLRQRARSADRARRGRR